MDRIRRLFASTSDETRYEPLTEGEGDGETTRPRSPPKVNWLEYGVFALTGVAMLWSWNMFLAAAPYFQTRFARSEYLLTNFQPSIVTVSTVANLVTMGILTKLQARASYPRRIVSALLINIASFAALALLTVAFLDIAPDAYFALLLLVVFCTSTATGLIQNGVFAFASSFGPGEYIQAIMTGQGVAGVAPCLVQIVSVLGVPPSRGGDDVQESPRSACAYFATAAVVSAVTLVAFAGLLRANPAAAAGKGRGKSRSGAYDDVVTATAERHEEDEALAPTEGDDMDASQLSQRKVVGLWALFLKLRWLSMAVFVVFVVTMQFAVYTQKIFSLRGPELPASRLFEPAVFIPLAFLFWNTGDLIGRTAPVVPVLNIADKPKLVFVLSLARLVFIPLYHLCNIDGRGAVIQSDFFYLFIVQFWFGFTSGWLGSVCMMGAPGMVEESEREAAGAFMGLMLVLGLSVGSIISFSVA